jgi:cobalamin biosynthetic protein CobC
MGNAAGPFHHHGGRLSAAKAAFPRAPSPWLDLSTGINPRPWSGPRATAADLARLPDPQDLAVLEALAAAAFGVAPERVVAVPGAEAGLRALPQLTGALGVEIVSPTYGGHAEAWGAAEVPAAAIADLDAATARAVVLVNPNNPDGAQVEASRLAQTARRLSDEGRWLIVDESFVEAAPQLSIAAETAPHLVVLRSFGKFYGLPGVRLGFVIGAPDLIARVRGRFGDWPVGAEAIRAGTDAYADAGWRAQTLARLTEDAARLDRLLAAAGFEVLGGTALFRLARAADAPRRFDRLCRHGVLTRPFSHDPTWLRFGLPDDGGWARLELALQSLPEVSR